MCCVVLRALCAVVRCDVCCDVRGVLACDAPMCGAFAVSEFKCCIVFDMKS